MTARKPPSRGPSSLEADPPTFEEALEHVESIIARIESGEIGLEESLGEYERGAALIRRCREILDKAELRVQEISRRGNESPPIASPASPASPRPAPDGPAPPAAGDG